MPKAIDIQTWTTDENDIGSRLDQFLTERLAGITRSQIQKAITSGQVTVNGSRPTKHRFLKAGDVVEFKPNDTNPTVATKSKNHSSDQGLKTENSDPLIPEIIEETPTYIVLDKPTGLLVHADSKTQHGTLVDFLIKHYPPIAKVGEDPGRPGIVHRLDREVSGLMVVAKTQHAYDELKKQFATRETEKVYLALVHGEVPQAEGDLKFRIARSTTSARMAARPAGEKEGKAAWTHFRTLERLRGASLLELHILSGRTHQIRAHLMAFQHPVIGDALYTAKRPDRNIQAPPRLMLQSVALTLKDPESGERRTYKLEPDAAFDQMRETLNNRKK